MKFALLVLAVAALACGESTAPSSAVMEGIAPFGDLSLPAAQWAYMQRCSGLKGDFSRTRWYTVSKIRVRGVDGYRAYWRRRDNSIFVLESLKTNPTIIEHEEMHALLRGGTDHPPAYFIDGPCGNLMAP